jgi:hypothetical protein|tara:strand:+ start:782 stop:988 length:207 start_codon:yes stop_codon:yes gene_type:complete
MSISGGETTEAQRVDLRYPSIPITGDGTGRPLSRSVAKSLMGIDIAGNLASKDITIIAKRLHSLAEKA